MAIKLPALPQVLTYNHWNSKKSKVPPTPETGIGKALKKVEEQLKKSKCSNLDSLENLGKADKLKTKKGTDDLANAIKAAKKEVVELRPLIDATKDLWQLLKDKAVEAKKSSIFPKASRELIEAMFKPSWDFDSKVLNFQHHVAIDAIKAAEKRLREADL